MIVLKLWVYSTRLTFKKETCVGVIFQQHSTFRANIHFFLFSFFPLQRVFYFIFLRTAETIYDCKERFIMTVYFYFLRVLFKLFLYNIFIIKYVDIYVEPFLYWISYVNFAEQAFSKNYITKEYLKIKHVINCK